MKITLHTIALILASIGAVNWGLIGVSDYNLVTSIFGVGSILTKSIYILVGVSGIYLLISRFFPVNVNVS